MRLSASLLAVVATHTQRFVDQQHVRCLDCPGSREELDHAAGPAAQLRPLPFHQTFPDLLLDFPAQFRMAIEKRAERGAVDSDRLGGHGGLDRGTARRIHHHCHFADIVAGRDIGANDFLAAADRDRDGHRAALNEIDRIVTRAFLDQRVVGFEVGNRRGPHHLVQKLVVNLGYELGLDLANDCRAVDRSLDLGYRSNQADHRVPVDFEQQRWGRCHDRRRAPPPGEQGQFAQELAGPEPSQYPRVCRIVSNPNFPFQYEVDRICKLPARDDDIARLLLIELRTDQEFADLQWRERGKERQLLAHPRHQLRHLHRHLGLIQLGLDQRFVGGRDVVAEDVFDDLVPLVETMLDQRIAGERADDIKARDLRLVNFRDLWIGRGAVAREHDAAGFDELSRRQRADSRHDSVAFDPPLALPRLEHEIPRLDALGLGIRECDYVALVDRGLDQRRVCWLCIGKTDAPIYDGDVVVGGKPQSVFDSGIAGADQDDFLPFVLLRVVELILNQRKVGAGYGQLADVALDPDRENDIFRSQLLAAGERNFEIAALAGDRGDLGIEP